MCTQISPEEVLQRYFLFSVDQSLVDPEEDCVYFCGNSLGICPKKTKEYVNVEIDKWEKT